MDGISKTGILNLLVEKLIPNALTNLAGYSREFASAFEGFKILKFGIKLLSK